MKKKILKILSTILLLFITITAWYEVPVTEEIKVSGKGKVDAPIRIALITDLHSCYYGKNQSQLIKMIDNANVDVILLSGDIFDNKIGDDNAKKLFEGISDRYPCYYVTGNHEIWSGRADEMKRYLREEMNVTVLDGCYSPLEVNGNTIVICGVDDPTYMTMEEWKQQLDEACPKEYQDNYRILLSHRPERPDVYMQYNFDMVVSGHAHGGQWRIPFTKYGVVAPEQGCFPSLVDGRYPMPNGADLIVSRGLCRERQPYPRFFNHPELVVIEVE